MLDKELLDILACPLCKHPVLLQGEKQDTLACQHPPCGCRYAIKDEIPVMLVDEAARPCPSCGTQRDWDADHDTLRCAKCGNVFDARPEVARPAGK